MSETSGFFNAELVNNEPDRSYEATDFANYYANLIGNGVFANPTNQLQVYADTEDTNSVKVSPGNAYINGYWYKLSEEMTIKFDSNSSTTPMWYSLNLQLNLTTREISIIVVSYPKSNTKPEPAVSRTDKIYELCLSQIKVKPGDVYIQNSDIYDLRFNENYCGIVAGLVKQISTRDLFSQYNSIFNTWLEEQRFMLERTPAGKLQSQILNLAESHGILDCKFDQISGSLIPDESEFLCSKEYLELPTSIPYNEQENYNYMVYYTSEYAKDYNESDFPYTNKGVNGYDGWGNFFKFFDDKNSFEDDCISIEIPGRYKMSVTINGSFEILLNEGNSNSSVPVAITPGIFLKTHVRDDNRVFPVSRKKLNLIPKTKTRVELNVSRNFVFEVSEEDISMPVFDLSQVGLFSGYFINSYGLNEDIIFTKLPSFDITIEPIKLNVGIPQDLIGFVNVSKEEYDTLVSEGKATQDTLYFVQNKNKIEMYLGEIKLSGGGSAPVNISAYAGKTLAGKVTTITQEE